MENFAHVQLPNVNKQVLRLGLATNFGIGESDIEHAADRGVNYWLWSPRTKSLTPVLKRLLAKDRDKHVVAVLSGFAYTAGMVRRKVESTLKMLGIDYVDVYKLPWLGRMSRVSPAIEEELQRLKSEGKILASATSIHDRPRAGQLARESSLDGFMLRYNAKHPGAEGDIFPHLEVRNPFVVAYTATSWRQLLKPVSGLDMPPWPGGGEMNTMTGPLCYRFCLSSPHVHVTLTGPADRAQLDANLDVLDAGPLSDEEDAWVREYGRKVKAKKKLGPA